MMQDRLLNGASLTRVWSDNKTELLGLFQYKSDAEQFARIKVADDAAGDFTKSTYIVACFYSGRLTLFGPWFGPEIARSERQGNE